MKLLISAILLSSFVVLSAQQIAVDEPQLNEQQEAFDAVVAEMRARCDVTEGLDRIEARLVAIEARLPYRRQ